VQSGDALGGIVFHGADGTNPEIAALIQAEVDGTPGADDMPGRLVFSTTADGASSPTEQMRITSTGDLRFNSGYGSAATAYGCRAWVNFNGTGTVAIRASGNVSSITDNGVGDYTVNFATAMVDANYSCVTGSALNSGAATKGVASPTALNTTSVQILTSTASSGAITATINGDHPIISVAIFR
jgi:hypothetical protein